MTGDSEEASAGTRAAQTIKLAVLVFLFSLALRVTWAALAHVTPISDFQGYDELAVRWLNQGRFAEPGSLAYRTPGYPGFLTIIYAIAGHSWKAAGLAQAVLGAFTSGLLVLLAAHVLSPRASAIAGMLHAVSPAALAYVPVLATETLGAFLVVSGVLCLAAAENRAGIGKYVAMAACGGLFGLLVLVRPAAVFFLPACVLLGVYSPSRGLRQAAGAVVFLAATGLVLSPWLVRNRLAGLGPFTLSSVGGVNLWMGNNDLARHGGYSEAAVWADAPPGEREQDTAYRRAARAWILSHPKRYLSLSAIRAFRLLGTEPDTWAAKYLRPTYRNDRVFATFRNPRLGVEVAPPPLAARAAAIEGRNAALLHKLRRVMAPVTVVALVLALSWWRDYAIIIFPVLCYLGGISLTYAEIRFRELADPLLFVPLAGLISVLVFRTTELARQPSRPSIAVAAAAALYKMLTPHLRPQETEKQVRAAGTLADRSLAERQEESAGWEFSPVKFAAAETQCVALWPYPTWRVIVSRLDGGLRCEVLGSSDPSEEQYGGVSFQIGSPKAVRLEVSFLKPRSIQAVCVEGYDHLGQRGLRWTWQVTPSKLPPGKRQTYVLVPGKQSWHFLPEGEATAESVREMRIFLQVARSTKAGFLLHQVEVAH